jgi:hypothetical protein
VSGGDPPMGDALIAALKPKINAEGGCNAGFLREDALLVVAFINDFNDTESKSWPYQQYDAIIAAKKDPNAVVMLGVVPQPLEEGAQEIPGCVYESDPINKGKIRDLIDRFPHRAYGRHLRPQLRPVLRPGRGPDRRGVREFRSSVSTVGPGTMRHSHPWIRTRRAWVEPFAVMYPPGKMRS